jgi:hypothetical protein
VLARGRDRSRAGAIAAARGMHHNLCFTMFGTQNIENFKLYRRPHQNIHLIFLFGNNDSSAGYTIQMSVLLVVFARASNPCSNRPKGPKRPRYEIRVV